MSNRPTTPKTIGDVFSRTRKVVGGYEQDMGVHLTNEQYKEVIKSERVTYLVGSKIISFEQNDGQWSLRLYGDPANYIDDSKHWMDHSTSIRILPSRISTGDEVIRLLRKD